MTRSPGDELDRLLNGLADGTLDQDAEHRLTEILRADDRARRRYREFMGLHAGLHWDHVAAAIPCSTPATERTVKWRTPRNRAVAAALVLVLGGFVWQAVPRMSRARSIVRLEDLSGAVSWSDGAREDRPGLSQGSRLPGGTLVTEGDAATAQLRFDDGTRLTLTSDAELTFADDGQKRLVLRHGTMTADVRPQPAGRPMVVRTPTAVIEVVGTLFSMSAGKDATAVDVEQGRVRLRRLADDRSLELPAPSIGVASLSASEPMLTRPSRSLARSWELDLGLGEHDEVQGEVLAFGDASDSAPRIRATPYVARRNADGTTLVRQGCAVRGPKSQQYKLAALGSGSVIRVRYRTGRPVMVNVMLSVRRNGWNFGGNFMARLRPADKVEGDGGWTTRTLTLADFAPITPAIGTDSAGANLCLLHVSVPSAEDGLEVAEMAVVAGSEPQLAPARGGKASP